MSSLLLRTIKWFGGLGAISVIPLSLSLPYKLGNISLGGGEARGYRR